MVKLCVTVHSLRIHLKFHLNWDKCWQQSGSWTHPPLYSLLAKKLPVNTLLFTTEVSYPGFLKVNISSGTVSLNCTLFPFNLTAPAAFLVKSTVHY